VNDVLRPRPAIGGKKWLQGMGQKGLKMEVTVQYCTKHVVGILAFKIGP
jgi:hypothetical protein